MAQSLDLLQHLKANPFVLAPMAGITDLPFRSFMREMGCGVVVTELVSATGLRYSSERTRQLMRFEEIQRPVGIQLFGEDPAALGEAAREVQQLGADFVDLNFGCPVPKVVKKGAGAAMLKDLVAVREVFRTVKSAVEIPVTVKIRTGWDEHSRNAIDVAQVAFDEGLTWVAIHGRTRSAGYSGWADWEYIAEVKAKSPLPILGNGDIANAEQAVLRLRESGCDGVLIGRGALKNPWIFKEALALWRDEPNPLQSGRNFPEMLNLLRGYLERNCEERVALLQLKKLAAWYSAGYPGSAQFRKTLFQTQSREEIYASVDHFFHGMMLVPQLDTSQEPFLMGGHG